jgi:hypothetical protein
MPIDWEELSTTEPRHWHLKNAGERSGSRDQIALRCAQPQDIARACETITDELNRRGIELATFDRFRG